MNTTNLPALLQRFFTDRLLGQLGASPHTVACYRDAFRLLLRFAAERLRHTPSGLRVEDLDAALLSKFLDHIEQQRRCSARTRNARLSALHAGRLDHPALRALSQHSGSWPRHRRRAVPNLHVAV